MAAEIPNVASTSFAFDQLIAGDFPLVTDTVTLASGQNLPRGSVLGVISASGKYVLATAAATDGSQNPAAVLVDDSNASAGDQTCGIYVTGEFNARAMNFGAGITAAAAKAALRQFDIFIKTNTISGAPV